MNNEDKAKIILALKHNFWVRLICYPFMTIKKENIKKNFYKSEDAKFIRSLKDTYEGKRCFIIGNGPSLTVDDLNKLKNEYCFASNKILWLFDQTDWRPVFYTCVDKEVFCMVEEKLGQYDIKYKFCNYELKNKKRKSDLHYVCQYLKFSLRKDKAEPYFSEDVSKYIGASYTVTCDMIQIAAYLGFNEIYLLGVDHNYSMQYDSKGKVIVTDSKLQNYAKGIPDWGKSIQNVNVTTKAYQVAKEYADTHGIKIYNATRGGKLEVFERVNLDDVLQKNPE